MLSSMLLRDQANQGSCGLVAQEGVRVPTLKPLESSQEVLRDLDAQIKIAPRESKKPAYADPIKPSTNGNTNVDLRFWESMEDKGE
ncbi:MAG: hypothetical protein A2030_05705 [Chloroflexi bacterium RBG_19FT_COMBO_50_10]|nr:MAG: hypothetical protein A2030_05705 [Chloroflexi bacterium RBG_19FT_COMBO_50_10]